MRTAGALRSENAGMSSERQVRILSAERLRFPGAGSSAQGKSGPLRSENAGMSSERQVRILSTE